MSLQLTTSFQDASGLGPGLTVTLRNARAGQRIDIETAEQSGASAGTHVKSLTGPNDRADLPGSVAYLRYTLPDGGSVGSEVVWVTGQGAGPQGVSQATTVVGPQPTARTVLSSGGVLPASGAYTTYASGKVAVPAGMRRATIYVTYTRGAVNGQAQHFIWTGNGTEVAKRLSPANNYSPIAGDAPANANPVTYAITVDLLGGETEIGITSAEVGVTATPGTWAAAITFG